MLWQLKVAAVIAFQWHSVHLSIENEFVHTFPYSKGLHDKHGLCKFKHRFVHTPCTFKQKFVHTLCTFKHFLHSSLFHLTWIIWKRSTATSAVLISGAYQGVASQPWQKRWKGFHIFCPQIVTHSWNRWKKHFPKQRFALPITISLTTNPESTGFFHTHPCSSPHHTINLIHNPYKWSFLPDSTDLNCLKHTQLVRQRQRLCARCGFNMNWWW